MFLFKSMVFYMVRDDEFMALWGVIYSEFKLNGNKASIYFNVLLLIRKLVLAVAFNLCRHLPWLQVVICSLGCWSVSFI